MAYIELKDYRSLGYVIEDEQNFDKYRQSAEMVIDRATRNFYRNYDLTKDADVDRVADFKRAVAEMVAYYDYQGGSKSYELNENNYNSVSIGRLSLSPYKQGLSDTLQSGLTDEAYNCLAIHGLLYRGVDHL